MIYMVIKKKIGNGTQVSRTISKHANTWATADNVRMLHFMRIWSNGEESGQ
jgi:hypothetical protein